jgi:hypothetical protein
LPGFVESGENMPNVIVVLRLLACLALWLVPLVARAQSPPTPLFPVGTVSERQVPSFKWTPIVDATDYQIRVFAPDTREAPGVQCGNVTTHPAEATIYFVEQGPEAGKSCPQGERCISSCATPADRFDPRSVCHPLRLLTACVPGTPFHPEGTVPAQFCEYKFSLGKEWKAPSPIPDRDRYDAARKPLTWPDSKKSSCAGKPYVWQWSVRAVFKSGERDLSFGEWSKPTEFWFDASVGAPEAPPPINPGSPHPVDFVNQSGMVLYVYYFLRSPETVDCKSHGYAGEIPPRDKRHFVIPANHVVQFVFQKSKDACRLDTVLTSKEVRGGDPAPEAIAIP